MTWQQILDKQNDLLNIIEMFHPNSLNKTQKEFRITAPRAEKACETIRAQAEFFPVELAKQAIINKNSTDLMRILSDTWFGAPESREVFSVPGFNFLCDILDEGIDGIPI